MSRVKNFFLTMLDYVSNWINNLAKNLFGKKDSSSSQGINLPSDENN